MTSVEPLVYYPAYCFHLSPAINKWCPLRAIDIHGLECRPGFEGDDVFFSLNHPIRWVRIIGVVLAIQDYYGHRIYTVDDSTGKCIECNLDMPKPVDSCHQKSKSCETATTPPNPAPDAQLDIDVGMVVEFRGSTKIYRGKKQIKILKIQRVKSTNQEVQFWNKIRDFRRDVISQPWVLDKREVRRCKRLHMVDVDVEEEKKKRRRKENKEDRADQNKPTRGEESKTKSRDLRRKPAKSESLVTSKARDVSTKGHYDALGL